MQKRLTYLVLALTIAVSPVARAEEATSLLLTDGQIGLIRANCLDVQSTLQRLDANDALARYNLSQQYNIISSKLMAPMNSRLALTKLNGVAPLQTAVDFDAQVNQFKSAYQQYEETIQRALKMNCKDQPVAFFDTIAMARDQRARVHQTITKINTLIEQYRVQIEAIQKAFVTSGVQDGGSE